MFSGTGGSVYDSRGGASVQDEATTSSHSSLSWTTDEFQINCGLYLFTDLSLWEIFSRSKQ